MYYPSVLTAQKDDCWLSISASNSSLSRRRLGWERADLRYHGNMVASCAHLVCAVVCTAVEIGRWFGDARRCVSATMTGLVTQCVGIGLRLCSDSHGSRADGRDNLARGRADSVSEPGDCASYTARSFPAKSADASKPRSVVAGAPSRVHVRTLRRFYRSP